MITLKSRLDITVFALIGVGVAVSGHCEYSPPCQCQLCGIISQRVLPAITGLSESFSIAVIRVSLNSAIASIETVFFATVPRREK